MISDENLARLPEDGDVSDRVARVVDDSFEEPILSKSPAKMSKRKVLLLRLSFSLMAKE